MLLKRTPAHKFVCRILHDKNCTKFLWNKQTKRNLKLSRNHSKSASSAPWQLFFPRIKTETISRLMRATKQPSIKVNEWTPIHNNYKRLCTDYKKDFF